MIKILPNLTWSGMEVNEGYNKPLSNTILLLSTSSKLELDRLVSMLLCGSVLLFYKIFRKQNPIIQIIIPTN